MSRATKIALWSVAALLAILAIIAALLLSFDWNRARPWINTRVSEASGRPFAIHGDLTLAWHAPPGQQSSWPGWIPWPKLTAHDVTFGNPDWAATRNMAQARQVTFAVKPLPLLEKRIVIPLLTLDTPRLVLQRQKDGRNNWTFGSGPPSAWRLELQGLALQRGTLQLIDAVKHADLKADLDTLTGSDTYRLGWKLAGSFNGETVHGGGKAGAILALQQQHAHYPVEADLHIGKTAIHAKGTLTDPRQPAALDLRLKISGVSLSHLYPLIGVVLPQTPPFVTEGRLTGSLNSSGGNWRYEKFSGTIGASDISGSLRYAARQPRPLLEGTVESQYLNFRDLAPLIGADSNAQKLERGEPAVQPPGKVLPVETFNAKRWTSVDADVRFTGRRIVREKLLPINNMVTRVQLHDGVLTLAPLNFGVAGGNLVSNIRLDGNSQPIKARLNVSARHLQLKQLFPTLLAMRSSLGEINGDAALSATGNSVAALLGSSNGEIKALINQGAVSKLLLEEIGLNLGSVIVTRLFGDKQVNLNCAVTDFSVDNGLMQARAFVIDTDDATIRIGGNINLAKETLALAIYPETKGIRIISLRSPLYLSGTFQQPQVGVDKKVLALKAGSAITLGALAPVAAALLPLVNVGPGENSECGTLLAQTSTKPQAPPAGKSEKTVKRK